MRFRFALAALAAFLILAAMPAAQAQTVAKDRIGVLLLHGKNPGNPSDPNLNQLKSRLDAEGMITLLPDMPWSARRYIDGDWDKAMAEIDGHVKSLRGKGATKIVIAGHSMGCPAAMSYAARHGGVDALVLLAPGHVPVFYSSSQSLKVVRDSVDEAKRMVVAGDLSTRRDFNDINQGRAQQVRATAPAFLSYFAPDSDAEMSVTAARIPAQTPALWVIGNEDPLLRAGRSYVFDKLPENPKNQYLEVTADHRSTPAVSREAVTAWIKAAVAP
jgi:pimeloyl-ACP methyl ester carboxylesterase